MSLRSKAPSLLTEPRTSVTAGFFLRRKAHTLHVRPHPSHVQNGSPGMSYATTTLRSSLRKEGKSSNEKADSIGVVIFACPVYYPGLRAVAAERAGSEHLAEGQRAEVAPH